MCDVLDTLGYLVTMDIEKAIDYLNLDFLLSVFWKKLFLMKISFTG